MMHHCRLVLALSLPMALAFTGCSSPADKTAPASTTPGVASRAEVKAHMSDHRIF